MNEKGFLIKVLNKIRRMFIKKTYKKGLLKNTNQNNNKK